MLRDKIRDRTAVVGVVGLGYVGLPLAIAFAQAGFSVTGYDTQRNRVQSVRSGESYIPDADADLLFSLVACGKLWATLEPPIPWDVDVVIICVPTPLTKTKRPDLSHIKEALNLLQVRLLFKDALVVLESSTYPGTTRELVLPALRDRVKYIAYSPERIDPGNKEYGIRNTPKLVGGIDDADTRVAVALYRTIVDKVIPVSSPDVAEMAKLFENVFRNVNIALVNEMAMLCERLGISVWDMIDAAATKPFGFMPFYPGVGVGGHCIPVDPYYVVGEARKLGLHAQLTEQALDVNEHMPVHTARRVTDLLREQNQSVKDAKVMVLGVAFKKDVGDTRESPALELMRILLSWGVRITYNDPYVPVVEVNRVRLESVSLDSVAQADCVVITTDHSCYDYSRIVDLSKMVFDTRGVTRGMTSNKIHRLGEKGVSAL